jgi:hypothetical protein
MPGLRSNRMKRPEQDIACDPGFASTPDDPLAEPIIVWQRWKSRRRDECLRLTISRYKEKPIADLRVFFTTKTGHMQASKKGITIGIANLPELRKALEKAELAAIDMNLLEAVS